MIEIPLNSSPEQIFSITIDAVRYSVRVLLNSRASKWTMNIASGGVDIVRGVGLIGGIDIFNQYNIPISNAYVINLENSKLDPGKENMGTAAKLFILTDAEVAIE